MIEAAAGLNASCSDVKVYSLAASAIHPTRETTATITSSDLAQVLKPPPSPQSQRWTLAIPLWALAFASRAATSSHGVLGNSDYDISIDTAFEGFTPLNSLDDDMRHRFE
jgi:hypothetical protein